MNARLLAQLEGYMQAWSEENCEEEYWPEIYVGGETTTLMARAAAAVFDAVEEFQNYAVEHGFLVEA